MKTLQECSPPVLVRHLWPWPPIATVVMWRRLLCFILRSAFTALGGSHRNVLRRAVYASEGCAVAQGRACTRAEGVQPHPVRLRLHPAGTA